MQGGKNLILPKDAAKCKQIFLRLSLAGNLEKPFHGTKWRGALLWTQAMGSVQFNSIPRTCKWGGGGGVSLYIGRRVCRHGSDGFHEVCGKCAWNLGRKGSENVLLSKYLDPSPPAILF